jgi:hypothetical protein
MTLSASPANTPSSHQTEVTLQYLVETANAIKLKEYRKNHIHYLAELKFLDVPCTNDDVQRVPGSSQERDGSNTVTPVRLLLPQTLS